MLKSKKVSSWRQMTVTLQARAFITLGILFSVGMKNAGSIKCYRSATSDHSLLTEESEFTNAGAGFASFLDCNDVSKTECYTLASVGKGHQILGLGCGNCGDKAVHGAMNGTQLACVTCDVSGCNSKLKYTETVNNLAKCVMEKDGMSAAKTVYCGVSNAEPEPCGGGHWWSPCDKKYQRFKGCLEDCNALARGNFDNMSQPAVCVACAKDCSIIDAAAMGKLKQPNPLPACSTAKPIRCYASLVKYYHLLVTEADFISAAASISALVDCPKTVRAACFNLISGASGHQILGLGCGSCSDTFATEALGKNVGRSLICSDCDVEGCNSRSKFSEVIANPRCEQDGDLPVPRGTVYCAPKGASDPCGYSHWWSPCEKKYVRFMGCMEDCRGLVKGNVDSSSQAAVCKACASGACRLPTVSTIDEPKTAIPQICHSASTIKCYADATKHYFLFEQDSDFTNATAAALSTPTECPISTGGAKCFTLLSTNLRGRRMLGLGCGGCSDKIASSAMTAAINNGSFDCFDCDVNGCNSKSKFSEIAGLGKCDMEGYGVKSKMSVHCGTKADAQPCGRILWWFPCAENYTAYIGCLGDCEDLIQGKGFHFQDNTGRPARCTACAKGETRCKLPSMLNAQPPMNLTNCPNTTTTAINVNQESTTRTTTEAPTRSHTKRPACWPTCSACSRPHPSLTMAIALAIAANLLLMRS